MRPAPPSTIGMARCQRRSRARSALRPKRTIAMTVTVYGIAVRSPISRTLDDVPPPVLDVVLEDGLLLLREPLRLPDAVVEVEEHRDAHDERGDRLDEEHGLPAAQAVRAVEALHDPARERTTEHAGDGDGGHEERHDA